jgi:hypothetical protein
VTPASGIRARQSNKKLCAGGEQEHARGVNNNMNMRVYNPPYALWSIWRNLSILNRGFILILGVVFVYCVFSTIRILLRVRSVRRISSDSMALARQRVATISAGRATVRQIVTLTLYFFGLILFLGLQGIGRTLGDSNEVVLIPILGNFVLQCAFAANVFLVFLVLHLVQWSGDAALNSLSRRLSRQESTEGFESAGRG